ncbi:MAG: hypothetical protein J1F12_06990 [Muribaculaceae bacterium]|nr:hypothetical protein [Muribaculaceae bacterium]
MVKVGIIGADKPIAGELLRILIHHPETDIRALVAPNLTGHSLSSFHHGFIGESNLTFTDKINSEDLDLIISLNEEMDSNDFIRLAKENENLKFIFIDYKNKGEKIDEVEIGLSEINRKALVRGAKIACILNPAVAPTLIALIPLARYLLLNSEIKIEVYLPSDIFFDIHDDSIKYKDCIREQLELNQNSFNKDISLTISPDSSTERGAKTQITVKSALPIDEIEKIYDQIYDDHNFSFYTGKELSTLEVEGTQKVLIRFSKPDQDTLRIDIVNDARMRGGAGDIVHVMNLFFGLHEKTGLDLKPSRFRIN